MRCLFCKHDLVVEVTHVTYDDKHNRVNGFCRCPKCGATGPVVEGQNEGIVKNNARTAYKLRGMKRKNYHTPLWLIQEQTNG